LLFANYFNIPIIHPFEGSQALDVPCLQSLGEQVEWLYAQYAVSK
jgi:hypothetical protein